MSSLRDLWQSVFPTALPVVPLSEAQWEADVGWVHVLRARVPAFDALDPGDLAVVPLGALAAVAPRLPDASALVAELIRARVAALLVVSAVGEPRPGPLPTVSSAAEVAGQAGVAERLAAEAAGAGLAAFRLAGVEALALERSVIGHLVNRLAELERRAAELEAGLQRLALGGAGLESLVAAVAAFLGRGVALEGRRGDPLVLHAPADRPAAAAAISAYLARPRAVALRIPLPARPPRDASARPDRLEGAVSASAGSLALLGDGPATDLEQVAARRVAGLLALELARDAAVRGARDAARHGAPLPAAGPPWVVLVARQPRDGVPLEQREEARRELRLLAPARRLVLRGDAESLELRAVAAADAEDPLGLGLGGRVAAFLGRPVAVSRPFDDPAARAVAEAEARTTLEAAERLPDPPVLARADRLAAYRLLGSLHNLADGEEQAAALLAPLLVGAPRTRRERLETLRAVLEQPGLGEAAAALGVHRNTVAYRVRAIERRTGWRLADPELRLPLAVAVRLILARPDGAEAAD